MSKLFIIIYLIFSHLPCSGLEWYSKLNRNDLLNENKEFILKNTKEHNILMECMTTFEKYLISKNFEELYSFRSESYRKIVPLENFIKNIMGQAEIPTKVYYSLSGSNIDKDEAIIKAYYVFKNKEFETCNETFDRWRFDCKTFRWIFVSNTFSWGSPVNVE